MITLPVNSLMGLPPTHPSVNIDSGNLDAFWVTVLTSETNRGTKPANDVVVVNVPGAMSGTAMQWAYASNGNAGVYTRTAGGGTWSSWDKLSTAGGSGSQPSGKTVRIDTLPIESGMTWMSSNATDTVIGCGRDFRGSVNPSKYWMMFICKRSHTGEWSYVGEYLAHSTSIAMLHANGDLYVVQCNSGGMTEPTFYRIPAGGYRQVLAPCPIASPTPYDGSFDACMLGDGRIVVSRESGATCMYDITAETWTDMASAPATDYFSVFERNGKVMRCGRSVCKWHQFDPQLNTWSELTSLSVDQLVYNSHWHGATLPSGKLFFPRGKCMHAKMFDPSTNQWSSISCLSSGAAACLPDGSVLMAGGVISSGGYLRSLSELEQYFP